MSHDARAADTPDPETLHRAEAKLRERVPPRTTPTWEIELLLSGATVFALLQVPGPLLHGARLVMARLDMTFGMPVLLVATYGLMVLYALIGMFVVHLAARAYWVALVGVNSVFPHGIDWARYRHGPIARREMQRQVPSLPVVIERADNFASLTFAFGMLLVLSALLGSLAALPVALAASLIAHYAFDGDNLQLVFFAAMALVLLPMMSAGLIDKLYGHRIAADGEPRTWLARVIRGYMSMPLSSIPAPLLLPLTTNLRGRRGYALFFVGLILLATAPMAQLFLSEGILRIDSYRYLAREGTVPGVHAHHYASLRDPEDISSAPFIQSEIVDGPYLRLFVPYMPERVDAAVEQHCPDLAEGAPLGDDDRAVAASAQAALLDCIAGAMPVSIDGAAVPLTLLAGSDPQTGMRGFVAMLPVGDLRPGQHELAVARLPSGEPGSARAERDRRRGPYRIAFWR